MGKGSSPPPPPDPKETAAAQTATNLSTAQANAILGNVNQVTPDGSLTYSQTGQQFINDELGQQWYIGPDGQYSQTVPTTTETYERQQTNLENAPGTTAEWNSWGGAPTAADTVTDTRTVPVSGWQSVKGYYVPQYTATQTLSPAQQAIKDQTDAAELNLAETANQQSSFFQDYLGQPIDINNEETEARLFELGRQRLDPMLAEARDRLETDMINRGIRPGSDSYHRMASQFDQRENDAYNSLLLSGRAQSVQEQLTERNQPINELTALLSGGQVNQPQFVNSQMPTIPTTDYAGIEMDTYRAKLDAWKSQQAQKNSMLGGLFGLGSSLIGAIPFSDDTVKKDKKKIGTLGNSLNLYEYRYKGEKKTDPKHVGLMASEVEKRVPEAVKRDTATGLRLVDYSKAVGG